MKNNNKILSLLLLLCTTLFASCGDDEGNSSTGGNENVNQACLSAIFPGDFTTTRSAVPDGHQLRCILELYNADNTQLVYREEVLADPSSSDGKILFDFELASGMYNCLMWADYIDANAQTSESDGSVRYADKYYDTSDLTAVSMKNPADLINNAACDAFFFSGEIQKNDGESLMQDLSLSRPVTMVSICEENQREFNLLQELTAVFSIPTSFNVREGSVVGAQTEVTYQEPEFNPEAMTDCTLFTFCAFANAESQRLGTVDLTFVTGIDPTPVFDITIPENIIPLVRGHHVKVSAGMMVETPEPEVDFDITYNIEVNDWEVVNKNVIAINGRPQVGDFFYLDGSYSSTYTYSTTNPCIGIVFAVAHDDGQASGDAVDNYPGTGLNTINGWVIAAYDANDEAITGESSALLAAAVDGAPMPVAGGGAAEICGFLNTTALQANAGSYPVVEAINNYGNVVAAPSNTSGWYWGATGQYKALMDAYAVSGDDPDSPSGAVGRALNTLADQNAGALLRAGGNWRRYWCSTFDASKNIFWIACSDPTNTDFAKTENWGNLTDTRNARAILTF